MARKRSKPETVLQARIVDAIRIAFPRYRVLRMNAGSVQRGARHIELAPKGFPDLLVLRPSRHPCGLEVKTLGGEASPEQLEWQLWFGSSLYPHAFVRSPQEALDFLARCP